ncbi:PDZ domain-containing protein, partial [Alicyclobacillaceae bacterium I2511]
MGFYSDPEAKSTARKQGRGGVTAKWATVVVLSALVGSGATLASVAGLQNAGLLSQSSANAVNVPNSPVGVSNVNVNINNGITQVVKQVEPAVVAVINYADVSNPFSQQTSLQEQGIGTGVYFYHDSQFAYIVTNNHVVMGAVKAAVVLQSGKHVTATIVGTDPYTDLAVIKVPLTDLRGVQPATFGNSNNIQVGEPAIAIGTPMGLDFADSVTSGIVSGKQRMMPVEDPQNPQQVFDYQAVLQTDAAINPGNSGGPLLNIQGQVIGINSSKIAAQNFEGMGFAIPSNEVIQIADEIIKTGHAVHPALGISGQSLSTVLQSYPVNVPVDYGVYVIGVSSSNAKAAGLKTGDVIVSVNGQTVKGLADLRTALFQVNPGQTVSLGVYRGSQHLNLQEKVGEMQSPLDAGSGASSGSSSGGGSSLPGGYGSGGIPSDVPSAGVPGTTAQGGY